MGPQTTQESRIAPFKMNTSTVLTATVQSSPLSSTLSVPVLSSFLRCGSQTLIPRPICFRRCYSISLAQPVSGQIVRPFSNHLIPKSDFGSTLCSTSQTESKEIRAFFAQFPSVLDYISRILNFIRWIPDLKCPLNYINKYWARHVR